MVNASVILRLNAVLIVKLPPVAEIIIEKIPAGVDSLVVMFKTVEHAGLQEVEEKDPVAPEGRPDTEKETA